jgi:malonyl-CoA/methylmalonyl-CoA synthetase
MTADNSNLYEHFRRQFAARADAELLATADDTSWRYADVDALSARMAAVLRNSGVAPGDRVSAQIEKSPQNLCLYLACLRGGFVFHPLNMAYKAGELEYFLTDAEPAAVVCDERNTAMIEPLAHRAGARQLFTLNADGGGTLAALAANADDDTPGNGGNGGNGGNDAGNDDANVVHSDTNDLAALLYSSGTTGRPKGIMLTHGNLLSNTRALVAAWEFTAADRLLHALPIFHVHGLFVGIGCAMLAGASMRWLAAFKAEEAVRFLPECTVMMGVPTYYTRLLAEPRFTREAARNVRVFISGSAPLLTETFHEFEARTGQRILERYGMTETNMNTSNPLHGMRKPGTVGPPLPGVEARIRNDAGETLAPGVIGNIEVKGPHVFKGYWKLPDKTAEDFSTDGFFRTGDQGLIDDDGYVAIVGRAKDMIITGGLNVYPKELETFLNDLPGVRESAVIGVPHADFGEGVVAVVVAEANAAIDEASLISTCKAELANFKVPKRVAFVAELPRNTMGKVQKNLLRSTYAKLLA